MTARSPWRDPANVRIAIALSIGLALANGVWMLLDNSAPSWDQSHYLSVALDYQRSFEAGGPIEFLHAVKDADPDHGPLFTVLLLPFIWIFGASNSSGLILNLCAAPILYFCAGEVAWTMFGSWFARLLTIVLVAAMPLLVGLNHNVLQDFLLVTLATVSILLLWKSEGFQRRWITIGMAVAMGLGTLAKVTFPLFVVGPLLVVVAQVLVGLISDRANLSGLRIDRRRLAINFSIAAAVFLVIAFLWYGPNFSQTLEYVRSTTSGPLSEGAGPSDPFTFHAILTFTLGAINFNLSWIVLLLGLVALVLDWNRIRQLFDRPLRTGPLWKLAFLLAWAVIPYLSVALAHNQDVRLMAPAFPAVAVLVAGAVSYVRWQRARFALAAAAVLVLAFVTVNHDTNVTPGFFPDQAKVEVGEYTGAVQLSSEPVGYEQLPGDDYATPVLAYIESVAEREPGGLTVPRTICMLQSEATMNSNTIGFLSSARGDPFGFADVVLGAGGQSEMEDFLATGCSFAVYVKQPKVSPGGEESRLAIVNNPYAANHMTPQIFALFKGPHRSLPLSGSAGSEGEPGYLSAAGEDRVQVFTRTPEA